MVKVAVTGVSGRMGQAVVRALAQDPGSQLELNAAIYKSGSAVLGEDVGELVGIGKQGVSICAELGETEFDLLIDFTLVDSAMANIDYCRRHRKAMVIGTTGFDRLQQETISAAAKEIPVVFSPNMSIGVNICFHLLKQAVQVLGKDCDIEITETHHRNKLDAPSGTALRMGEIIANELDRDLSDCAVYGRAGVDGIRDKGTIGFASLRAGDVVGDHTVLFASEGETLEISHKASSRMTYAVGAVKAANWLSVQPLGLYDMQDVLNLRG